MFTISTIQIVLSVLLVVAILLQQRGGGLGSAFGGGEGGHSQNVRRGTEKVVFIATIIIAVLFLATAIIRIII